MDEIKYQGSVEVYNEMLDLGAMPETQSGILSSDFLQIQAVSGYKESETAPISFHIPATSSVYTQLNASFAYFKVKIFDKEGKPLGKDDEVGPSENFFGSLIDNCIILLNDTPVSRNQGGLYSYKHYFSNLFGITASAQASTLSTELWYPDSNTTYDSNNKNFQKRRAFIRESKTVELIGRFHDGIMNTKVIPDFVPIQIHLRRKNAAFALNAEGVTETSPFNYKIIIEQATFFAKRLLINPKILQMHHQLLNSGKRFHYNLKNLEVKTFQIAVSQLVFDSEVLWSGKRPTFLMLGVVPTKSFTGQLAKSPYNFDQHNIQQISVSVDGSMANQYRQLNFEDGLYLLGYDSLRTIIPFQQLGHGIDRGDYLNKFIVAVELQPTHYDNRFHVQGNHQVKIQIRFKTAPTESLMGICCGMIENLLTIDKEGQIYSDALAL